MEHDPKTPQYMTSDKTCFAYDSACKRWPIILTQCIDHLFRTVSNLDPAQAPAKIAEGKKIVSQFSELKYEVQHNRALTPLPEDDSSSNSSPGETAAYNDEIKRRGTPTWLDVAWLFAECYMYRRISTFFSLSEHWKGFDVFAEQKNSTFRTSRNAVFELASRYKELVDQLRADKNKTRDVDAEKLLFMEMCDICLWGNATDLSLLTNLTYEDIQKLQGSQARRAAEKNILVNDLSQAFNLLKNAQAVKGKKEEERRVDIVLDNAGFELYVDLILAGYLLSSGLATHVVLHPKSIPWFVSDVLPSDFANLLNFISDSKSFFETPTEDEKVREKAPLSVAEEDVANMDFLFKEWAEFHRQGQLILRPNRYWTMGGSFWRLPAEAPELYADLKSSELVIFKGDLNYRKLTGDARWDATTPFEEALGPMGPSSGLNILCLRTCKADVVVGLPHGKDEELRATENGGGDSGARKWAWYGKWAVICLSQGKKNQQ